MLINVPQDFFLLGESHSESGLGRAIRRLFKRSLCHLVDLVCPRTGDMIFVYIYSIEVERFANVTDYLSTVRLMFALPLHRLTSGQLNMDLAFQLPGTRHSTRTCLMRKEA